MHGTQRADVHVGQLRISARMGMNAADHAQTARIAAQMHVLEIHAVQTTDGDIQNRAAAGNINADFAIDRTGECRQHIQQLRRCKNFAGQIQIIQRFQLRQHRIANAFFIAINHIRKFLLYLFKIRRIAFKTAAISSSSFSAPNEKRISA